jgi:hypothetical protein
MDKMRFVKLIGAVIAGIIFGVTLVAGLELVNWRTGISQIFGVCLLVMSGMSGAVFFVFGNAVVQEER